MEFTFALEFQDDQLGFAGGVASSPNASVFRTRDGGRSWTQHQLSSTWVGYPFAIAIAGASTCYVMTSTSDAANAVFRSRDGGESWLSKSDGLGGRLFALDFLDADRGFVAGGDFPDARIWRTADGGDHWTPVRETGLLQSPIFAMNWDDPQTGLVANDLGLFHTADGGQHGARVSANGARSLSFRGRRGVAGDVFSPNVQLTEDGGVTWLRTTLPWSHGTNDVVLAAGRFYACGLGSNILEVLWPEASERPQSIR